MTAQSLQLYQPYEGMHDPVAWFDVLDGGRVVMGGAVMADGTVVLHCVDRVRPPAHLAALAKWYPHIRLVPAQFAKRWHDPDGDLRAEEAGRRLAAAL